MSFKDIKEKANDLKNRINERTSELTKQQILTHNKKVFQAYFEEPEGPIFVHPEDHHRQAPDGKKYGYVYKGIYDNGGCFLGVKVYTSDQVVYEHPSNKYKNLKHIKNKKGQDLFSIDDLVEYDYEHTNIVWQQWLFRTSKRKNKRRATTQVLQEIVQNRLADFKKRHL